MRLVSKFVRPLDFVRHQLSLLIGIEDKPGNRSDGLLVRVPGFVEIDDAHEFVPQQWATAKCDNSLSRSGLWRRYSS